MPTITPAPTEEDEDASEVPVHKTSAVWKGYMILSGPVSIYWALPVPIEDVARSSNSIFSHYIAAFCLFETYIPTTSFLLN